VLQFGSIYGNVGFMGLPLVQAILGQGAVLLVVVNIVLFGIAQWSHGATVMGGKTSIRRMILNPGTIPMAIGMALFLCSIRLPSPVLGAIGYMADLNTPLAMVIIGAQMSRTDMKATFNQPLIYAGAAVKLLLIPALTAVLLLPLKLDPMLYCVCVVLAGAPTAGVTSIFAQRFEQDTATSAQLITLTTLLSAFTLPVFAVIAQRLAG
jgi:predicted permease